MSPLDFPAAKSNDSGKDMKVSEKCENANADMFEGW